MEPGKFVAIITGAISIFLAVAYLILVQLLDSRGEMIPAPISQLQSGLELVSYQPSAISYQLSVPKQK